MHTILAVDDAKDTLMLLDFDLSAEGYNVISANDGQQALDLLKTHSVDLILLDMYMPGMSGLATLEALKSEPATQKLPVIMLSASNDEDEIVLALELGADDYVTKPYIAKVLQARIRTALRLRVNAMALEKLASTDFLTGLKNRGSFEEVASGLINQSYRHHQELVLCMCDIDHFKSVNDTYGHEAGDKVLKEFAKILKNFCRDYDVVGRIGGEEFALCMPNATAQDAVNACERFRKAIEQRVVVLDDGRSLSITVSIGIAHVLGEQVTFSELLKRADEGLYRAKSTGRNKIVYIDHQAVNPEPVNTGTEQSGSQQTVLTSGDNQLAMNGEVITEQQDMTDAYDLSSTALDDAEQSFPGIEYQVGVANVLGDDGLFKEILVMFYQDHYQDAEKLAQAIAEEDVLSAKHLAHTLKGVACSIGATALYEHSKYLDNAINQQQSDSYQLLFSKVKSELDKVTSGIYRQLSAQISATN